jgi:hypothetical protein
MTGYAHLASAVSFLFIGGLLLWISLNVRLTHEVNLAFYFGEYLTQAGLSLLMRLWPFVWLFAAFILACALDHALDALEQGHERNNRALEIASVAEAVIAMWTAGSLLWVTMRWERWRR